MALDTLSKAIGDTIDLSVGDIIAKYGGDKRAIAMAAQKGEVDPTKAVMAGMAVDRVVASAMKPQSTTVAEDTFGGGQQGLMAAAPQQPPQQPQMGQPAAPQQPGQGLNQVPVPQRGFAGGGIIGFKNGGSSATLMAALDRVLAQLKARDPGLNVDYVKNSVLQAPPEQQQQLVSDLMNKIAVEQVPPAGDTFTGSIAQRTVDPKVMAAMQAAGRRGLTADEMAIQSSLSDSGAQMGAPSGVKTFPGSQVYAGIAQRGGNIYEGINPLTAPFKGAADVARSGMQSFRDTFGPKAKMGDEGIIEPSATDFLGQGVPTPPQVDPFSATERFTGNTVQTDPGFVRQDRTPSDAMLKKAAEEQETKPAIKPPEEKPTAEEDKKPKTYDDYLKQVQDMMGKSDISDKMRREIASDKEARKKEKQQALWMRVAEAGLGIMGGESPYAAVNIGRGATSALKGYADDLREQKRLDREDRKILLDLDRADRAEQRENYKLAANLYDSALNRMSAEKRTELTVNASKYAADKSVEAAGMLKPSSAIRSLADVVKDVEASLLLNSEYRNLKKTNPAAAETYRLQAIEKRKNEVGLTGQGAGVNTSSLGPVLDFQTALGAK